MSRCHAPIIDLLPEYAGAELGDRRRTSRLLTVAAAAARQPAASLRASAADDAALEGAYRLLNNPEVQAEDIFSPHQQQTRQRAAEHGSTLVLHDTTEVGYGGKKRKGLGRLHRAGGKEGFLLHTALAVAEDQWRTPLGVAHFEALVRPANKISKSSHRAYKEDPYHEGRRWAAGVDATEQLLDEHTDCIHVMDREGDAYDLLSSLCVQQRQFVIRMSGDRATTTPNEDGQGRVKVRQVLDNAEFSFERTVRLSRRTLTTPSKIYSDREPRQARLAVRAVPVELRRPESAESDSPKSLKIHAVQVYELDAPEGTAAVEWTLLTNLSIESDQDIARIVDIYRARWLIEEFFKALKTGCAIESRQHESFDALLNVVVLYLPIAWRMLALRTLTAQRSQVPATRALTRLQLEVLFALSNQPLPDAPTAADAMWALAALAGHRTRRKLPGWQVLSRGFERLVFAEQVWRVARSPAPEM